MTKPGLAGPLAALILLPIGSLASTLHADKTASSRSQGLLASDSSLMRREARSADDRDGILDAPAEDLGCGTLCPTKDFLMGVEKTNSCRHSDNETKVVDQATCIYAAGRNKVHLPRHADGTLDQMAFVLHDLLQWESTHPAGCFHAKCHDDATKDCYYLNTAAEEISNASLPGFDGTPVCERQRYRDGTINGQGGCPAEYQVVMNETLCQELCGIYDDKCNEFFRVGTTNYSMHYRYPHGCFHLKDSGGLTINGTHSMTRVYFNDIHAGSANVIGTPMCEVAAPLDCEANPGCGVNSGTAMTPTAAPR